MLRELLAPGSAALNSAAFEIEDGQSAVVTLKSTAGPYIPRGAIVDLQMKTGAGAQDWTTVGYLDDVFVAGKLDAAGTYRIARPKLSDTQAVGVAIAETAAA